MTTDDREVFTREKVLEKLGKRNSFFASLDATQFELLPWTPTSPRQPEPRSSIWCNANLILSASPVRGAVPHPT